MTDTTKRQLNVRLPESTINQINDKRFAEGAAQRRNVTQAELIESAVESYEPRTNPPTTNDDDTDKHT